MNEIPFLLRPGQSVSPDTSTPQLDNQLREINGLSRYRLTFAEIQAMLVDLTQVYVPEDLAAQFRFEQLSWSLITSENALSLMLFGTTDEQREVSHKQLIDNALGSIIIGRGLDINGIRPATVFNSYLGIAGIGEDSNRSKRVVGVSYDREQEANMVGISVTQAESEYINTNLKRNLRTSFLFPTFMGIGFISESMVNAVLHSSDVPIEVVAYLKTDLRARENEYNWRSTGNITETPNHYNITFDPQRSKKSPVIPWSVVVPQKLLTVMA